MTLSVCKSKEINIAGMHHVGAITTYLSMVTQATSGKEAGATSGNVVGGYNFQRGN